MNGEKRMIRWYEVAYVAVLLALLVLSVYYLSPHKVGVIDLKKVAVDLGYEARMITALEDKQRVAMGHANDLRQELGMRSGALTKEIESAKGAEKDKLKDDLRNLQADYQQRITAVGNDFQQFRNDAILTFRARVQPILNDVARKHRLDLVLEPSVAVFRSRKIDITDDVIARCKKEIKPDQPIIDPSVIGAREQAASAPAGQPTAAPAAANVP